MRQILICAWLLVMPLAAAACSGERFTPGDPNGTPNQDPTVGATAGSSSSNRGGSGDSSESSSGSSSYDTAGKSPSGGTASGGSGSGGAFSGGMSSQAGSISVGTGGDPSEECASASITFRMLPGPDLAHDYLCDAGCGTGWLTLTDAEGATAYSIFSACGTASCESCEVQACAAAACLPTPLTAQGSELVWNGTYLAKDTCGANMACQKPACVKPGKYKAKACAAINGGTSSMGNGCTPKNEQLCAEAEFDFPATATVQLILKK